MRWTGFTNRPLPCQHCQSMTRRLAYLRDCGITIAMCETCDGKYVVLASVGGVAVRFAARSR